jgi:N-methylhydantoinase A/oxoprolinase/acetone carboxylase beta subunit
MTAGFEDVLEIARTQRTRMYDLQLEAVGPTFLAPRRRRHGIHERVAADGSVVTPLDEEGVRRAVRELADAGVSAIAVCYLFSFLNPEHELRTRAIIEDEAPHIRISLSAEIDPQFREYERVFVTALDAYLRAAVESYVGRMGGSLRDAGIAAPFQIMQSRGGIQTADAAARRPISMLLSGLAAGVQGARFAAQSAGTPNVVTLDIGGTSCDVALIEEGKPLIAGQGSIGGYPLRLQHVDVNTIGAGGGSLVWIDEGGGLRVGPQSAGAVPGPACYGRGGIEATVTDASLVLGYLRSSSFAGGEVVLDADAADEAIERIAARIGLSPSAAAAGIHRILNARMADEIRLVSVQRGYDPREFGLLALGGGGALHGGAIALELDMPRLIVPEAPGVLSAFGLLVSDIELEQMATVPDRSIDEGQIAGLLSELDTRGLDQLARDGAAPGDVHRVRLAEMRYAGQSYELSVPLGESDENLLVRSISGFHDLHERVYGHCDRDAPIEIVAVRTVHRIPTTPPSLHAPHGSGSLEDAQIDDRPAYFDETARFTETPRYDRRRLATGQRIRGPAILEQPDTTIVVRPGQRAEVHGSGAILIERDAA